MKKICCLLFTLLTQTTFCQEYIDSVFTEHFDNNLQCWPQLTNQHMVSKTENGKFFIAASGLDKVNFLVHPFQVNWSANFNLEAQIVHDGTGSGRFGISWGMNKKEDYYLFSVDKKGELIITSVENRRERILAQKTVAFHPGEPCTFSIMHESREVYFLFNGEKVYTAATNKVLPFGNNFAFYIEGHDKIMADELTITGKFMKMHLVSDPVKGYKKENLGKGVNSEYEDLCPIISPDGNTLYFIRKDHPLNTGGVAKDDIWYSEKKPDGSWEPAKNLGPPVNTTDYNTIVSVAADNNAIYIAGTYNPDGSFKGQGLSVCKRVGKGWSAPQEVPIKNFYNTNSYVMYSLSPDRKFLVEAIERKDSKGKSDLYVSFLGDSGKYTEPFNLGATINTTQTETTPFLAADDHTLYFSSRGHAGYGDNDIFVTHRLDDTWRNWSVPQNLGPEVNTSEWDAYFTIPASGEYAYMTTVIPENGKCDLVRIKLAEASRPKPVVLVKGKVLDKKTNLPVSGKILYKEMNGSQQEQQFEIDGTGEYSLVLQAGKKYSFRAEKENYYAVNDFVDLVTLNAFREVQKDLYLVPLETGQSIRLNNVFFDFDQAGLGPESAEELNRLVDFLHANPKVHIEIAGHTDDKGSGDYNLKLSQQRAESVMAYLVQQGIEKNRLKSKGYGSKKPLVKNDTDEHRATNRRVEFMITKR